MAGGGAALTYTGCIGDLHAVRLPVGGDAWLAVILLQPGSCFVACSWYWSCCASVSACVLGVTTWFTRCQLSANETGLGGSCKACKLRSAEPDSCRHRVESFDVPVLGGPWPFRDQAWSRNGQGPRGCQTSAPAGLERGASGALFPFYRSRFR